MKRQVVYVAVGCLLLAALSLVCCASPAVSTPSTTTHAAQPPNTKQAQSATTKPAEEKPQYGGTITRALTQDVTYWNPYAGGLFFGGTPAWVTNQTLWSGDWTKGPAGGYGTDATDWAGPGYDIWDQKVGNVAESWKWTVDAPKDEGTIVYQIRQGIHYALNPASEASRLVNGREVTADDVVSSFKTMYTSPKSLLYRFDPELRTANITKTGDWEVTVEVPLPAFPTAIDRFGGVVLIFPQEILQQYSTLNDWKILVGTGPFMVTDYVSGSAVTYSKNDSFWMTDPIGPGKGNRLPYIDTYTELVIPDTSTEEAALRTGKVDEMTLGWEDADQIKKSDPQLEELDMPGRDSFAIKPRVDRPPFNDVRVRQALMMATDFEAVNQDLYSGKSQILNYPIPSYPGYGDVYLGLDDPAMPESVKELYTYNPEKAKGLLAEAGYPNGFTCTALTNSTEVNIYSVYKSMWAKVGINLNLDVKELGAEYGLIAAGQVDDMVRSGATPIGAWYDGADWIPGTTTTNPGRIDDPVINKTMDEVRLDVVADPTKAEQTYKDLLKYVLAQAYAIPVPGEPQTRLWWPWLKNYSGEYSVGWWHQPNWIQWVWVDQSLKKQMGY